MAIKCKLTTSVTQTVLSDAYINFYNVSFRKNKMSALLNVYLDQESRIRGADPIEMRVVTATVGNFDTEFHVWKFIYDEIKKMPEFENPVDC